MPNSGEQSDIAGRVRAGLVPALVKEGTSPSRTGTDIFIRSWYDT